MLLVLVVVLVSFFGLLFGDARSRPGAALEEAWKSGRLKDPVEAIVMAERLKDQALRAQMPALGRQVLLGGVVVFGLGLISYFLVLYYPVYNFCWGDYLDIFQRKESRRKFILVVVIIGVLELVS
jgi:hypothetical protein